MCVSPYSWASSVQYIRWLISSDYITFVTNAPLWVKCTIPIFAYRVHSPTLADSSSYISASLETTRV